MSRPELSIPQLEPPFDRALADALDYVFEIHDDVVSINLAGNVFRGKAGARSNLDLYVIIGGELRHRDHRFFAGVPVEMFFNNEERSRGYFAQDQREGRARAVRLMAFGHVIYDPDGVFARLRTDALDVTHKALVLPDDLKRFSGLGTRAGTAVAGMIDYYERHDMEKYGFPGAPLHDPCVIAYLIEPQLFGGTPCRVDVETESELTMGQTVVDWWGVTGAEPNAMVIDSVNRQGFIDLLVERIGAL